MLCFQQVAYSFMYFNSNHLFMMFSNHFSNHSDSANTWHAHKPHMADSKEHNLFCLFSKQHSTLRLATAAAAAELTGSNKYSSVRKRTITQLVNPP